MNGKSVIYMMLLGGTVDLEYTLEFIYLGHNPSAGGLPSQVPTEIVFLFSFFQKSFLLKCAHGMTEWQSSIFYWRSGYVVDILILCQEKQNNSVTIKMVHIRSHLQQVSL